MEGSISFYALGWIVVFVIIVVVGVLAAIVLKNLNQFLKYTNTLMDRNMDHLNRIIPNLKEISDNSVLIVRDLQRTVDDTGRALDVITRSTADTVLKFNATADRMGSYAVLMGELTKIIVDLFRADKR